MDISLKNKIIKICLLSLAALIMTKAYSAEGCDDKLLNNNCLQVFVNGPTGKALADIVIYLEPLDGQVLEKSSEIVVIGQLGKSFTPYVSVSQVKSQVDFVNQDDITHHIYSAGSENKFSFKIRAGQTNSSAQFDHVTEVAMGCNIHDWMSGFLLVVDTPYFGKTDQQGLVSFIIAKQGRYKVVVWHPQMQTIDNRMSKDVTVLANSTLSFALKNAIAEIPLQESDDDFDFLSDYE